MHWLDQLGAHWGTILAVAAGVSYVLSSIVTVLTPYEKAANAVGIIKFFISIADRISALPMKGTDAHVQLGPVGLNLPFKKSTSPVPELEEDKTPPARPGAMVGILLLAFMSGTLLTSCCHMPWAKGCAAQNAVIDCTTAAMKAEFVDIMPEVFAVLTGGQPNWQDLLAQLEAHVGSAVVCAAAEVAKILEHSQQSSRPQLSARDVEALARAKQYLASKQVKF